MMNFKLGFAEEDAPRGLLQKSPLDPLKTFEKGFEFAGKPCSQTEVK